VIKVETILHCSYCQIAYCTSAGSRDCEECGYPTYRIGWLEVVTALEHNASNGIINV
jgi:hypothetical protein